MSTELIIGIGSMVAGIVILAAPKFLNYVVAAYLIAFGILTLVQYA